MAFLPQPTAPQIAVTAGTNGDSGEQGAQMYTTMFLPPEGKREQQALMIADACSTTSIQLFITDRVSNLRLLVDNGSDLCVVSRRHVPWRK
jgi:hypothetical protein